MDKNQNMDEMMVGPRLFCETCYKSKVLSPCHCCLFKENCLKQYCRGCGQRFCQREKEICKVLEKERLLLKINEMSIKKQREAHFSYSQLNELPAEIGQLTNLQHLSLYSNQLRELPPEIVQLTELRTLDLSCNQLNELPPEITKLTSLQTLDLSDNQISELPTELGQLPDLGRCINYRGFYDKKHKEKTDKNSR